MLCSAQRLGGLAALPARHASIRAARPLQAGRQGRCQQARPAASYGGGQQQYGGPSQGQGQGLYPPIYQQEPQQGMALDASQEDALRVGTALRNIGWLSFWGQLALTVVSTTILLFSTGVPTAGGATFSPVDLATIVGILAGYVSTFLAWSYTRAGQKLGRLQDVRMGSIAGTIMANSNLNLLGLGVTIVSLQALVGQLVAKTLASASGAGFYGGQARGPPPPVAFDVFSVQACTNTLMAHFVGLMFSNWLLIVINRYTKRQAEREAGFAADSNPSAPPMPAGSY